MKRIKEDVDIQTLADQIKQMPADQQAKIKSMLDKKEGESPVSTEPASATVPGGKPSSNEFAKELKSTVDNFVSAGGALGAPAVKSLLKDIWMQAGGLRAESYKTKLSRLQTVINESNLIREEIKALKRKKSPKRPKNSK